MSRHMIMACSNAGKFKQMTNKVSNGDMSNGTTGWQHYSNYSTESVVSGELKSLRNSAQPFVGTSGSWNIPTGRKVYYAALLYGNKTATINIELHGTFATTTSAIITGVSINATPTRYSGVLTTASNNANGITFKANGFSSSGDYIMIDNVLVIDLTAEFGAGNEPSAATMDAALASLTNSWFDGTQNIPWAA